MNELPIDELDQTIKNLMEGKRDPERMKKAAERMDKMREELRAQYGETDIAVDLIRESRDE